MSYISVCLLAMIISVIIICYWCSFEVIQALIRKSLFFYEYEYVNGGGGIPRKDFRWTRNSYIYKQSRSTKNLRYCKKYTSLTKSKTQLLKTAIQGSVTFPEHTFGLRICKKKSFEI